MKIKGGKKSSTDNDHIMSLYNPSFVHFLWRRARRRPSVLWAGYEKLPLKLQTCRPPEFSRKIQLFSYLHCIACENICYEKKHVYTCSVELQKSFISTRYLECCPLKLYSFISWFTNTKTMLIRTFSINEKCHNRGWFS